jgi:hypothetical protein
METRTTISPSDNVGYLSEENGRVVFTAIDAR